MAAIIKYDLVAAEYSCLKYALISFKFLYFNYGAV